MKKTAREQIISICQRVARRRSKISLLAFRRACWRDMPDWAREEIDGELNFWSPILICLDDFYFEWQKKIEWDKKMIN